MKTVIVWLMMIHTPAMPETPEHHLAGYAFAAYENEMLCEVKAMAMREDFAAKGAKRMTVTCEPLKLVSP
jgi:hypothetical protein